MPKKAAKKPITTRKQKIAGTSCVSNSASCPAVTYLQSPVKSQSDDNEYRVVKLSNGLTATLIHRPDVSSDEESAQAVDNDHDGTEDDEVFLWYQRMMTRMEMVNCKLCVNVGSFNDPPHVPAASRLVSRALTAGSKKYPQEDDFMEFIMSNRGLRTTYDRCETTSFFFQIPDKLLRRALDRFSQFFVAPLMRRRSIINARHEIMMEYCESFQCPEHPDRKEYLFGDLAAPGSPVRVFGEHYLQPLNQLSDGEVHREVLKFRESHYTADRMTLVIESRLPLDTLEDYVKEYFSKIPGTVTPVRSTSTFNFANCFRTMDFSGIAYMKPFVEINTEMLELCWSTPPRQQYYRSKPHKYLAWLINRDGDGSLLGYLRKRKWCTNLISGVDDHCPADNSVYSLFSILIVLTDEGYKNHEMVLGSVFSYLNVLRRAGPIKRIHDEIRSIEKAKFSFTNERGYIEPFHDLCEDMQLYSSADYLTGSTLCFEYDAAAIKKCMNLLTPEKANVIMFDENFNELDMLVRTPAANEEGRGNVHFMRTYYTRHCLSRESIEYWKVIKPLSEFKLPEVNAFIADDFALIPVDEEHSRRPVKICQDEAMEVWYMTDAKFRLPEGHMIFHYVGPVKWATLSNTAMRDLFVMSLNNSLDEALHSAKAAGLRYEFRSSERGFEVWVCGFSQKLPLLVETITTHIAHFSDLISENSFEQMKKKQLAVYLDIWRNAGKLAEDVRLSIMYPGHWTSADRHVVIAYLELETFRHFVKHLADQAYVQCLVQGNIEKSTVVETVRSCLEILKLKPTGSIVVPTSRPLKIVGPPRFCRVQGFSDDDWVQNYYQFDTSSLKISIMIDLLMVILKNPLCTDINALEDFNPWDFNPTKQCQGYSLAVKPYCRQADDEVVWGDRSIEEFRKLLHKMLKDLSEKKWRSVKKVLTKLKQEAVRNLRDEVNENWHEIVSGECDFDRRERELKTVTDLEINDFRELMPILTTGGPQLSKLSVQVVGRKIFKPAQDTEKTKHGRLEYSAALPALKDRTSDHFVTNVEACKRDLQSFSLENERPQRIKED